MLNLTKKIYSQIKNHALMECPNECCGLLINFDNKLKVFPCRNIAEEKTENFKVNYLDYLVATQLGKITAYYHSHCKGMDNFSELDKLNSFNHEIPLILYHVPTDEFKISHGEQSKYIGKKFEWNKQDCLSLIQQFYNFEFGIKLPDIHRHGKWDTENPSKIWDNFQKFGFKRILDYVDINQMKYGDIVGIIQSKSEYPSHLMIYLGSNQVLHQRLTYSIVEIFSETFKKLTHSIFRYA